MKKHSLMKGIIFVLVWGLFTGCQMGQHLIRAIQDNNLNAVKQILDENKGELERVDLAANTPLHYAVMFGNKQIIEILLKRGAEVNHKNIYNRTAFQKAELFGKTEIAQLLKSHGADTSEWTYPSLGGMHFGQSPPGSVPEIFAPGVVSREYRAEWGIAITPEGNEVYYTQRRRPDHGGRIWFLKCDDGIWSESKPASFTYDSENLFSMEAFEYEPHISPDGSMIYYGSKRPLPNHDDCNTDLLYWVCGKERDGWGNPRLLAHQINDLKPMFVSVTSSGTLYFTNTIENKIFMAVFENGKYKKPESLPAEINFLGQAAHPFVAPDESYLIFDGRVKNDFECPVFLYVSFKDRNGQWTRAIKFNDDINRLNPALAFVSRDGKYLFFESNVTGYGDIYWVDAKVIEVLKPDHLKKLVQQ